MSPSSVFLSLFPHRFTFCFSLDVTMEWYSKAIKGLSDERLCVSFDYLGRGKSDKPKRKERQDEYPSEICFSLHTLPVTFFFSCYFHLPVTYIFLASCFLGLVLFPSSLLFCAGTG